MSVNRIDTLQYDAYLYETLTSEFQEIFTTDINTSTERERKNWMQKILQSEEWELLLHSLIYYTSTTTASFNKIPETTTFGGQITGVSFVNTSKWKLYVVQILIAKYLAQKVGKYVPKRIHILHRFLDVLNYLKLLMSSSSFSLSSSSSSSSSSSFSSVPVYASVLHRYAQIPMSNNIDSQKSKIYELWNFYEIDELARYCILHYLLEDVINTENVSWAYVKHMRKFAKLKKNMKSKGKQDVPARENTDNEQSIDAAERNESHDSGKVLCPECGLVPYNVQYTDCCNKGYCYYCKCKIDEYGVCSSC